MFGNQHPQVVQRPRSFLGTAALGVSMVAVSIVISASAVGIYAMNIIDRKTGNVFEFADATLHNLPELIESLPPMLSDMVNDERDPDYLRDLDVSVTLADSSRGLRPTVVVHNRGDEVVSLLSMRIVVVDDSGVPITETNEWAATPIAADDGWRGPLLPGAVRRFSTDCRYVGKNRDGSDLGVEFEVTDIRVWRGAAARDAALTSAR